MMDKDHVFNKHLNLRLNELAQEAHLYAVYDYRYPDDMSEYYHMIFEKRFAELIIKECAKIADQSDANACEWIGGDILTHFGVED